MLAVNLTLLKGNAVVGVFWGDFTRREPGASKQNNRELMQLYLQGKIKPHISQVFPLENVAEALNTLLSRQAKGKIVINTNK